MSTDRPTVKVSIRDIPAEMLVRMVEECAYRCEAGPLEHNVGWQELKRRVLEAPGAPLASCDRPAEFMVYPPDDPLRTFYACREHLVDIIEDGNLVAMGDIPDGAVCCFARAPQASPAHYDGVDTFVPGIGTVRECIDCGALIAGGPTRCKRCAKEGPPGQTLAMLERAVRIIQP